MNSIPAQVACALFVLAAAPSAHADYLVDTGAPTRTDSGGLSVSSLPGYYASAGASFAIAATTTIGTIETFGGSLGGGAFDITLYAGAPGGTPLFRHEVSIASSTPEQWLAYGGLNWTVKPGNYTVAFEPPGTGTLEAYLTLEPPKPLATYWYGYAPVQNGPVVWKAISSDSPANFALRVAAVPEPQTYAMYLAGLCLIGWTVRQRRRAGPSRREHRPPRPVGDRLEHQ